MHPHPDGLMIIHPWFEPNSSKPLRARIRSTKDVSEGFTHDRTVADIDAACGALKAWLEELEAANPP
jgi:hypothetical protein